MDKITLHGEYVLRGSGEPVRVLAVDAGGPGNPRCVVTLLRDGTLRLHDAHGFVCGPAWQDLGDIIPAPTRAEIYPGRYLMRNGRTIHVITVTCPGPKPIVCVTAAGAYAGHWHANGRRDDVQSEYDLMERF